MLTKAMKRIEKIKTMKNMKSAKDITYAAVEKLLSIQPYPKETDYYVEAKNWYGEVYESMICSRDRYRLLAMILGILLTLSIIAIVTILPLKRYFYRIMTVNQVTGEVAQLKELEPNQLKISWVMTRYFINQYIQNKNTYHYEDIRRLFNLTISMSDSKIAKNYESEIVDTNSNSPINALGKDGYREVTVLSISQLNANTALARYRVVTHYKEDASSIKTEDFQAVVKWDYQNNKASLQDRDLNPLGFRVTYYQASPSFTDN